MIAGFARPMVLLVQEETERRAPPAAAWGTTNMYLGQNSLSPLCHAACHGRTGLYGRGFSDVVP
eukprot:scaffold658675_cov62-Prasinocladus_malaysianus.AAC.1